MLVKGDGLRYEPATCQSQVQRPTAAPTRNTPRSTRTCAMSIHFSMMRARCDVDDDAANDGDGDGDGDDRVSPTTDAMTRCVTALNWSTVADTDATVSSEPLPLVDGPRRPFCLPAPLVRRDQTDPTHCCGSTLRNRSCDRSRTTQIHTSRPCLWFSKTVFQSKIGLRFTSFVTYVNVNMNVNKRFI